MSTPDANLSSSSSGAPAAVAPPASTLAQQSLTKTMGVLVRREFWEHRNLWTTPLVVAGLMLVLACIVHAVSFGDKSPDFSSPENRLAAYTLVLWAQTVPQFLVMSIFVSFYLMDCLYTERKDRSILFWKSLPVSDATTVVSKLLVGLVIVPCGVFLVTMVSGLLFQLIWSARIAAGSLSALAITWDTVAWLKVQGLLLYGLIVCILWFAPLAAVLLLTSVWVHKNVFLWTTLVPVTVIVIEKVAFGTRYAVHLLEYRTWGVWNALGINPTPPPSVGHGRLVSLADLFDNVEMSKAFLNIDLWLGLAVAAAFVLAAIRIRRYRDDT